MIRYDTILWLWDESQQQHCGQYYDCILQFKTLVLHIDAGTLKLPDHTRMRTDKTKGGKMTINNALYQ